MLIPFPHLLWVLPAGALLLVLISISQGLLGRQRRERLAGLAAHTIGTQGARLLSLLMAIGLIGWSGFHGGVSGASTAQLLHLPQWAGAVLIIAPLYLLSIFGINRWAALSWVTTGAALALTIFALTAVDLSARPLIALNQPPTALTLSALLRAFSTIIGYATLFSLRTPDFTWDFARQGDVVKVNCFYFVPLLFSLGVGALLYRATGNWNIADVLAQTHSAALGHLFLIVAVISPLISGWYSGAFAISHLTGLRPNQSTLFICILGFVLAATRFDQQLLPFLTYLSAGLGPALVLMLLVPRLKSPPATAYALGAWLAGAVIAVGMRAQGQPFDLLVGMGVSLGVLGGLWGHGGWKPHAT